MKSGVLLRKILQGVFQLYPIQTRSVESLSLGRSALIDYIKRNTVVSRNHLTPEIALHLITEECDLWRAGAEDCLVPDPFWAFYWPGGQALTRYLLENPSLVSGKRVLDVGSGCGASAIAAKWRGASRVLANDTCKVAAVAMEMNFSLNQVNLEVSTENLIGLDNLDWDVVLLGDMFYDPDFTDTVYTWLKKITSKGTNILLGDPGRVFLMNHPMRHSLKQLACYDLPKLAILENSGFSQGTVWNFISNN